MYNSVKNQKILLMTLLSVLIYTFIISCMHGKEKEKITFSSKDGLIITADLYTPNPKNVPFIILFHQAGWSRGEYNEIAPKLNKMGFNCLAVDQRSGNEVNGIINLTKQQAVRSRKSTGFLDALPDMESSIEYVKSKYPASKLIIWGSSYSASLVIKLAGDKPELIDGVLSFSPGEYSEHFGTNEHYIKDAAKNVICPIFITSKKSEMYLWEDIFEEIPSKAKHSFLPKTEGNHGSCALWKKFPESKDYFKHVEAFLNRYFKVY